MQTSIAKTARPKAGHSRTTCACLSLLLLALPVEAQAQFVYEVTNGTITITGYTGSGGAVVIPDRIPETVNGLPVTAIGEAAFEDCFSLARITIGNNVTNIGNIAFDKCTSLTNVTVPGNVVSIGDLAFGYCNSLSAITVEAPNPFYSSVGGVLFNKSQTTLIECPGGKAGSYTVPNGVTSIGDNAFSGCASLTSVVVPNSLTNIGAAAFWICTNLTAIHFQGNAPTAGSPVFNDDNYLTVYYLPGTTGWGPFFGGPFNKRPAVSWNPQVQVSNASFGVQTNQFGFSITGTSNLVVVVEASTNLANSIWFPLATNTLATGSFYFSDPQWTDYPARFYRLRWP
jgi:hypothetical protein